MVHCQGLHQGGSTEVSPGLTPFIGNQPEGLWSYQTAHCLLQERTSAPELEKQDANQAKPPLYYTMTQQ